MSFDLIALFCVILLLIATIITTHRAQVAYTKDLNTEIARTKRILAAKEAIDVEYRELMG